MLSKDFRPSKPFPEYKWKWASLQCTEGLNDPVILLGVLFRMRRLELLNRGIRYSSDEFTRELVELSKDVSDSVGKNVNLAGRTGERNLIRNSGQYWRALNLIPQSSKGIIKLTDFGRMVADREISQAEFAAMTVKTLRLPNQMIQSRKECELWRNHGITIYPLKLILEIECELFERGQGYVTPDELIRIIIPLSGSRAEIQDYVNFILWYRNGELILDDWDDFAPESNDRRIAREFLLFLSLYGYLDKEVEQSNMNEKYSICDYLIDEIRQIISGDARQEKMTVVLEKIRDQKIVDEVERKRTQSGRISRPNQAAFRKAVLAACGRCVITNVTMPEVLEAAHIKPFKYNGLDDISNGFAMRTDIHTLFDTGHLRISPEGKVELSSKALIEYGRSLIPPSINIPDFINRDFLRWRWENYNGA